jgi:aromatic ring-cleaving dioxygenase
MKAKGMTDEEIEKRKNENEFLDSNKSKDGTQLEVTTETISIDENRVVIDYHAEVDYDSESGKAAIEAQTKIANRIAAENGHWEVEHLMDFAVNADLYLPDLHMTDGGVTFLTWFEEKMGDSSVIPKGWFNRDKPAIQDAYAVWWEQMEKIQPTEPPGGWPSTSSTTLPDWLGGD